MFKRMTLLRRRDEQSTDAFQRHWSQVHSTFVLRLPGIRRYVQNDIVNAPAGVAYNGIVELWFDDEADLRAAFASAAGRALPADEANFIDGKVVCDVEEHVLIDQSIRPGSAKLISIVSQKGDRTAAAWDRWKAGVQSNSEQLRSICGRLSLHRVAAIQRVGSEASSAEDLFAFIVYHFVSPEARSAFLASPSCEEIERTGSELTDAVRIAVAERELWNRARTDA